jgi:two-component system, cell cycle response regulator
LSHSITPQRPDSFAGTRARAGTLSTRDPGLTVTQRFSTKLDHRDRALLVRIDATNSGQVHTLAGSVFSLGRHPDNAVCIDDQGLSRYHAKITMHSDRHWIEDLNSSNGTYLNGRRVTSCELANGDTIQLGPRVSFRFSVASEDEERVLKQLYEASVRDPMTRVFNRQYFASQIASELSFAVRHRTELSVLLLDIDFFKKVNDTYGHLAGDEILRCVARELEAQLRTEDLLARYGGEEFIVLLRGISLIDAARAGERLRAAVQRLRVEFQSQHIPVTISVGCASLQSKALAHADELVAIADARLYAAKRAGRNRVMSADETPEKE